MTHFVYTVKKHIGNVFNKPPRQNAPRDRVLTSVILKRIEWAFRKVYPTKIPGMVHQGLLAPQSLFRRWENIDRKSIIIVSLLNLLAWKASWAHRTGENENNDKIKSRSKRRAPVLTAATRQGGMGDIIRLTR